MYVLLIFILNYNVAGDKTSAVYTTAVAEYSSENACKKAAELVENETSGLTIFKAICTKKGD